MPEYLSPGVYIEEQDTGAVPIQGVSTSTAGFLGETERGPTTPQFLSSFADYRRTFGGYELYGDGDRLAGTHLAYAVDGFFQNGGTRCFVGRVTAETETASSALGAFGRRNEVGVVAEEHDFGSVVQNTSRTWDIRIENVGDDVPVTVSNVEVDNLGGDTVVGEFATDFDPAAGLEVDPGETETITVTFSPTDATDKSATVNITHDGTHPATDLEVDLRGTGVAASAGEVVVSPASPHDFGTVPVGATASQTFTLSNVSADGGPSVTVTGVEMRDLGTDTLPDEFGSSIVGGEVEIDAGDSTTITVEFEPRDANTKAATLRLTHDGPAATTIDVELAGEGEASVEASPDPVDFGTVALGARAYRSVTVHNRVGPGDPTLSLEDVTVTGLGADTVAGEFGPEPDFDPANAVDVPPGGSHTFEVAFEPADANDKSASLEISYDDGGAGTLSVPLSGEVNDAVVDVEAVGPGIWGGNVSVAVEDGTLSSDLFKLVVRYWSRGERADATDPDHEEVYDNLSPDEQSSTYYVNAVNDASNFVELERLAAGRPTNSAGSPTRLHGTFDPDAAVTPAHYRGDATAQPGERTGLAGFAEKDDISIVCVPDENDDDTGTITGAVRTHCEQLNRFAVLQAPERAGAVADISPPVDSEYAAYYYPWLEVLDPLTNVKTLVPPGGHVAGIYARSDAQRGVHKAPANEVVRGVIGLQRPLTKAEQDLLNPRGVNCIRSFTGRGIRVWGARTTSSNGLWKYLNVRRLFLYVENSLDRGTQWSVFEPNDERLWARVRQSVTNFLTTAWRDGALQGTTPEEAFFVTCDRTTMTQDDIDNGRLIVEIGIAPVKPAEFVIFRITQWTGGVEGA